jgi:hypothetical protein
MMHQKQKGIGMINKLYKARIAKNLDDLCGNLIREEHKEVSIED